MSSDLGVRASDPTEGGGEREREKQGERDGFESPASPSPERSTAMHLASTWKSLESSQGFQSLRMDWTLEKPRLLQSRTWLSFPFSPFEISGFPSSDCVE